MNVIEAQKKFSDMMKIRLEEKEDKGWSGWDNPQLLEELQVRLLDAALEGTRLHMGKENLIDAANLAMMVYFLQERMGL